MSGSGIGFGGAASSFGFGASSAGFGATSTTFGSSNPSPPLGGTGGAFGAAGGANTTFGSTFGNAATATSTAPACGSTTAFGAASAAPTAPKTTFGASSTTTFGTQATAAAAAPAFGATTTFGQPTTFGAAAASKANAFGSTTFGAGAGASAAPESSKATVFGATTTFGQTPATTFGSAAKTTFGEASKTTFGAGATVFGGADKANSTAPATATIFGASAFGSDAPVPKTTTVFGTGASNAPKTTTFGSAATAPAASTVFGKQGTFGNAATVFGGAKDQANEPPKTVFGSSAAPIGAATSSKPRTMAAFGAEATPSTVFGKPGGPSNSGFPPRTGPSKNKTLFGGAAPTKETNEANQTTFGTPATQKNADQPPLPRKTAKPPRQEKQSRRIAPTPLQTAAPLAAAPSPEASPVHGDPDPMEIEKADLATAVNIEGLCVDMCSPKERAEQIRLDDLSAFEKGDPPEAFIIKRFQRAAASHKLDIPSEIRPLGVLRRTQLYLEQEIIDLDKRGVDERLNPPRVPDLLDVYQFFWNRARMIRNDFTLQNYRGGGRHHAIAMDVHERIARFYILCQHELIENTNFVEQQNMEQLGKTMKSLQDFYDDARLCGNPTSPFEAEFAGYYILLHLNRHEAADVLKYLQRLPPHIVASRFVQFAMDAMVARHTNDYVRFFRLAGDATLLQSCLLHRYFVSVRSEALNCMNRVYRQPYPLETLADLLGFDDVDQARQICEHHCLPLADNDQAVVFGSDSFKTDIELRQDSSKVPVMNSFRFVFSKQADWMRRDVCRGVTEYDENEYPKLSRSILDTENQERQRLYPGRAPYSDPFSIFEGAGKQNAPPLPKAFASPAKVAAEPSDSPQKRILEEIASRKQRLDDERAKLLQKIREREEQKKASSDSKQSESAPKKTDTSEEEQRQQQRKLEEAKAAKAKEKAEAEQREKEREKKRKEEEEAKAKAKAAAEAAKAKAEKERKEREEAERRAKEEAQRRAKEQEEERKRKLEREKERAKAAAAAEAARLAAEEKARQERARQLERDIKKLSLTWLKINFEQHEAVLVRKEAYNAVIRAEEKKQQDMAKLRLRFAMWRRFLEQKKQPRVVHPIAYTPQPRQPNEVSVKNRLPVPRIIPAWTQVDAQISSEAHTSYLKLQADLWTPVNPAAVCAPVFAALYPQERSLQLRIGIGQVENRKDPASGWLSNMLSLSGSDSTSVYRTPPLQVTIAKGVMGVDCVIIAGFVRNLVEYTSLQQEVRTISTSAARRTFVLVVADPQFKTRLENDAGKPSDELVEWKFETWSSVRAGLEQVFTRISQTVKLFQTKRVPLRDAIDDVLEITLYQSSSLLRSLNDVALHVHDALEVLKQLVQASDPTNSAAVTIMERLLGVPVPSEPSQSSWAWIEQLPLDARQRTLCLQLVEAAWQHEASPLKAIVYDVYQVVLDQVADMCLVTLPSSWIAECQQLRALIPQEPRKKPSKRQCIDQDTCHIAPVAKNQHVQQPSRRELQAKWKQQALQQAIAKERAAHQKFIELLEDQL